MLSIILGSKLPDMDEFTYCLLFGALLLPFILARYGTALRRIPGPFLASLSSLWRFWVVWNDQMPEESLRLHKKHGALVRIGPNMVSCSSPEAVHMIYRARTGFQKVNTSLLAGEWSLTDVEWYVWHATAPT